MAKKSGSRCDTKNINKTKKFFSKKRSYYRSDRSDSDFDYDSYLSSDINW